MGLHRYLSGLGNEQVPPGFVDLFSYRPTDYVELTIYDARGARVRTLVDQVLPGGAHRTRWDGRDQRSFPVASGVYFYRLAMPGAGQTGRMVLVR